MPMTKKDKTSLLRRVELFSEVSTRALGLIADRAVDITFGAGDYIVRQGQVGTGFYLIASGRVRIERGGETVARLGSGEFFGELSVLDQMPRTAHVIADEPTVCLALPSWDFTKLLEQNPKITLSVLRVVARRLRAAANLPHH
jgi:CRP/FNR family cyclic AMP-dependent transcriptional regulator